MRYVVLNAAFITVGMAVIVELLPPYAKNYAGVNEREIGLLWMVNSIVVVIAQLPIAKLGEGRSRMRALALMGVDLGRHDAADRRRGRLVRRDERVRRSWASP